VQGDKVKFLVGYFGLRQRRSIADSDRAVFENIELKIEKGAGLPHLSGAFAFSLSSHKENSMM